MLSQIYLLYQHVEGCISFGLMAYMLYCLCGSKEDGLRPGKYVLISTTCFYVVSQTIYLLFKNLPGLNPSYWIYMVSFAFVALLMSHVFLASSCMNRVTYILFFLTFIQLYKIVCSPFYELEHTLNPHKYALLDMTTGFVLFILLLLFSLLFSHTQIGQITSAMPKKLFLILYFPTSILLSGIITANTPKLWLRFAPILAAIIITNLPIIYYFFASIISSYEQQKKLDVALQETKAQLSRYRFSIVMQEKIKKQRHETKNTYFFMQTLLAEGKYEQLEQYLNEMTGEKLSSLDEIQTGNILMDYILNRKISESRKYNIKVYSEILIPENLRISEDALCTILLNLLDNAIWASKQEDTADIHIKFHCVQNYLELKIKNRTAQNVLAINPKLETTKANTAIHGFGVKIIQETVDQQDGILDFDWKDGYFIATVMLPL